MGLLQQMMLGAWPYKMQMFARGCNCISWNPESGNHTTTSVELCPLTAVCVCVSLYMLQQGLVDERHPKVPEASHPQHDLPVLQPSSHGSRTGQAQRGTGLVPGRHAVRDHHYHQLLSTTNY